MRVRMLLGRARIRAVVLEDYYVANSRIGIECAETIEIRLQYLPHVLSWHLADAQIVSRGLHQYLVKADAVHPYSERTCIVGREYIPAG